MSSEGVKADHDPFDDGFNDVRSRLRTHPAIR